MADLAAKTLDFIQLSPRARIRWLLRGFVAELFGVNAFDATLDGARLNLADAIEPILKLKRTPADRSFRVGPGSLASA
jgi:hypothetical protein